MILVILSFISPILRSNGGLSCGFYPTEDTLLNTDVSSWIKVDLLEIKDNTVFFVEYSTNLEMAEQKGKVTFDPAYANYSIVLGFQHFWNIYMTFYIDHYCRHVIDKELERGKAVFNAENFVISNVKNKSYRFDEEIFYRLSYIFYPQGIIVDWLNSKPYYRHRFLIETGRNFGSFTHLYIDMEYTISNDSPAETYYHIKPGIYLYKKQKNHTIYSFIDYYITAREPFRSPDGLFFIGIGYTF